MSFCRVCSTPARAGGWRWDVCEACEGFQRAVHQVAEEYREEVPEAALQALVAGVRRYDSRTGQLLTDLRASALRASLAGNRQHGFYGAFERPSQVQAAVASTSVSILDLLLASGLLPPDLTTDLRAFLDEMRARTTQLTRVLTYQRFDQQWCAFLADQMDEEAVGKTEREALEHIYQRHPDLRVLVALPGQQDRRHPTPEKEN